MASGIRTFGIDVSHWNGKVSWDVVLKPDAPITVHFAYVKASQLYLSGSGHAVHQKDSEFDENWATLKQHGLKRGAYHYCMPDFTAQEMADLFLSVYHPSKGDLLPTLDVEDEYVHAIQSGTKTRAQLVAQIVEFGKILVTATGHQPFLYIRKDIADFLGNPPEFAAFPLWLANYNHPPTPPVPKPWTGYTLWQYSEQGHLAGVPGNCDLDYLNGPPALLDSLLI